jgi:HEAT repeat protein
MNESVEWERVATLLGGLHCVDRGERNEAVRALKALDREAVLRVLGTMLKNPDLELRCDAAEALLRIDSKQTLNLILPLLTDSNRIVRREVCGLLHDFGDKRALPSLVKLLLTDPEGDVRHIAAYALGEIGDSSVLPALRQAVELDDGADHEGRPIRDMAAEAIDEILARC